MAKWSQKVSGEISKLRSRLSLPFGWGVTTGALGGSYKLDSSKVDYELTKELYFNTNDDYKLGAGFAKSIINNTVSFMGVPMFKAADKDAQEVLNAFFDNNISNMQRTQRDSLRDGDCYVWVTREEEKDASLYPEESVRLVYNIIPPGQVKEIKRDPVTGMVEEYLLSSEHEWEDERGNKKRATVIQHIRRGEREVKVDGDIPPGIELGINGTPWDFIPIVHFKNEGDEGVYGQSDLEPIEPFLKAYHDVMLHAMQGSKMHSTPRLKLKVKNVGNFLKNNFGITDPVSHFKKGGTIDLDGKELMLLTDDEDASFIEAKSTTGDAKELLKLLFYCIVDTSETPEFVFGVHTPSSLSSVKEQMPILIRSIERKREHFADNWKRLARIVLAMTAQAENESFETFATELQWVNIDPRTSKEISEELLHTVNALILGVKNNLIGEKSAINYLAKQIDTMNNFEEEDGESEIDRIKQTRINRLRMPDSDDLEGQLAEIKKQLIGSGVNEEA
ncbi:hypothetical protein HMPREF9372_3365 [Sporosarcina newyorkensis 2681]|uniref:Phage portal protein n=1 Tax=Sporosarcina newyorkensis 2681 TaxID=1027292 RepID=F9DX34_9BACL|nr:phage portal protein [Sporosarcina newyorkensis]EGQ21082.1 hypothetical protein HMPREF9372_3365 [Sporosarcina newyorkensis 2681]